MSLRESPSTEIRDGCYRALARSLREFGSQELLQTFSLAALVSQSCAASPTRPKPFQVGLDLSVDISSDFF